MMTPETTANLPPELLEGIDVDANRSLEVRGVAAAFVSIAFITVVLRCYVRLFIVKAFGWDDGSMVIAMLFYIMFSACMIGGSLYGTGRHYAVLTPHQRVTAMEYWWLCEIAYCFASVACKISVCIFLLRITIRRLHVYILYIVMLFTVICGIVFMFLMLLQCKPLSYFWTKTAYDPNIKGTCIDMQIIIAMTYVYSTFAALCDFTVGILPIFLVRKLNMRRQTKLAVIGILSMACIASCAVIIRFPFVGTFADPDFLYATVEIAIWSNIETGLGIAAGSLATLRPLLRKLRGTYPDPDSYPSGMPGAKSASRIPGRSRDRPFPLASLDHDTRLRPDKLAVTVTTVQSQTADTWTRSGSQNSSEERLNLDRPLPAIHEGEMGLSIYRTVEVTATTSPGVPRETV